MGLWHRSSNVRDPNPHYFMQAEAQRTGVGLGTHILQSSQHCLLLFSNCLGHFVSSLLQVEEAKMPGAVEFSSSTTSDPCSTETVLSALREKR